MNGGTRSKRIGVLTSWMKDCKAFSTSINLFQPNVTFYIETSHRICTANQTTGFCLKYNTERKVVQSATIQYFHFLDKYKKHIKHCYPLGCA